MTVNNSPFDFDTSETKQEFSLDFKRVAYRALRHWYILVISLVTALVIGFYQNRYTQPMFPVSASILIREKQEASGGELLYKNALTNQYRNYLNEPFIIRSYPLIETVIKNLNLHVSFYREGYFMTTESYSYVPVIAHWCGAKEIKTGSLIFTLINDREYELKEISADEEAKGKVFSLDDSIHFNDFQLCINRIPQRSIKPLFNVPFYLTIQHPQVIAESYIARLNVEWAEVGSGIINLSLSGSDPKKESDFLNNLIESYRQIDLDKKNETADRTIDFIKNQLAGIKDSLRTVEYQLERFGNSSRVKDMSLEAQRLLAKLEGYEIQKSELLIYQNYYKYLEDYLTKEDDFDQVILPSSVGVNDPILNSMLANMVDLQLEAKLYLNTKDRNINPLVTNKIDRIKEIKRDVRESLGALRSTDKIKMDFLLKQLNETERQMNVLPSSERQLISVQRNYSLLENLYVFLMQKLSEAGISKASNTSDIVPINPPKHGGAISPKPIKNYSIALLLGIVIPGIIFVVMELLNNKVQSKADIEKITQIPFIGGVGHSSSGNNLIVSARPKSGVAESFRALRSNLNYFTGNKSNQVFMVSSSISGEGKTFTTINLATVLALSGRKTLIVGADMRRPKIFEDFNINNNVGLSTYLSGLSKIEEVIQKTSIEHLYLISGGPIPPNPSELLLSERFETFIKETIKDFEFIVIDTPPLALVADAFVMSKFADHTVFVMRQNYSPKEFVKSIDEYYKSGKLNNISILLNDISKSGLGYGYGSGYVYHGYSYGYGSKKKNTHQYYED